MTDDNDMNQVASQQGEPPQDGPGLERAMRNKPDHGEGTYRGKGLLVDRVALITGADSGIGRAVAIAYAREGADIALSFRDTEAADGADTARLVEAAGRRALLLPGDIRTAAFCRELVAATMRAFGRLDVLVNNAAMQAMIEKIDDISEEDVENSYRTNVFASIWLAQAAARHMRAGSAIVNTSSVQSKVAGGPMTVYASTKGAINALTVALSNLLAPQGIRVNAVAPGPIWTPIQTTVSTSDEMAEIGKNTPLGRAGQPAELAGAYVLLASDEGSYITGAVLPVTGGKEML